MPPEEVKVSVRKEYRGDKINNNSQTYVYHHIDLYCINHIICTLTRKNKHQKWFEGGTNQEQKVRKNFLR